MLAGGLARCHSASEQAGLARRLCADDGQVIVAACVVFEDRACGFIEGPVGDEAVASACWPDLDVVDAEEFIASGCQ